VRTSSDRQPGRAWGEEPPGRLSRLVSAALAPFRAGPAAGGATPLGELPVALRRSEHAAEYVAAERAADHRRAAAAASVAMDRAAAAEEWWQADAWGHRALWHAEKAELALTAVRTARRIGDIRVAGGDPASARRYYAEAIDEARDIGAEHEQGLATAGLGRAMLELGDVTTGRRLGAAAVDLLERARAPGPEVAAARELQGSEKRVGQGGAEEESE
jgi:hypothetical protein